MANPMLPLLSMLTFTFICWLAMIGLGVISVVAYHAGRHR